MQRFQSVGGIEPHFKKDTQQLLMDDSLALANQAKFVGGHALRCITDKVSQQRIC